MPAINDPEERKVESAIKKRKIKGNTEIKWELPKEVD
jgi:hypothetical protein